MIPRRNRNNTAALANSVVMFVLAGIMAFFGEWWVVVGLTLAATIIALVAKDV